MIETRALTKKYRKLTAVNQLNLRVERGELFGFIGPNGAGKTTTIQILATLLAPTSGEAFVAGQDVRKQGNTVRCLVGYMPDSFGVYENLRVHEYLGFFAAAYDVPPDSRSSILSEVLELTDLADKREAMVGELSRGMQQRLGLARVLVHDPEVLLLDEPASGLDPRARIEMREILRELQRMGKTVLLSSHILSEVSEICTSIGIIEGGNLVVSGPLDRVLAQAGVGNVVRVRIDGEVDGITGALGGLEGVERVETADDGELRVLFGDSHDGAPEIAAFLIARGIRIRRLDSETIDLEDAYLRLTTGQVS